MRIVVLFGVLLSIIKAVVIEARRINHTPASLRKSMDSAMNQLRKLKNTLRAKAACVAQVPPCNAPPKQRVAFDHDDSIVVYFLEAPLMESSYKDLLGKIGLKHVGLGLRSTKHNHNYTLEYVGKYGFINATVPLIIPGPNNAKDVLWCNDGELCFEDGIDNNYWDPKIYKHANMTEVAKMNGDVANTFIEWVYKFIENTPLYDFWSVEDHHTKESFLEQYTCHVFVQQAMEKLHELGVKYDCSQRYFANDEVIYSHKPKEVDEKDPKVMDDITHFYSLMQMAPGTSIFQFIEQLAKLTTCNPKFVYSKGKYYELDLELPFLSPQVIHKPFPGCPA